MNRPSRSTLITLALGAALVALARLGTNMSAAPPWWHPSDLDEWWAAREPLDAAAATTRQVCLVLIAYLLLVGLVRVVSIRRGWAGVAAATTRLLPRVVLVATTTLLASSTVAQAATGPGTGTGSADAGARGTGARMEVIGTAGTTIDPADTTTTSTTASTSPAPPAPPPPAMLVVTGTTGNPSTAAAAPTVDPAAQASVAVGPETPSAAVPPEPAARTSLPWAPVVGEPTARADDADTGGTAEPAATSDPSIDTATHLVQPGDHLWSIAEDVLSTRLGGPADDRQIAAYWSRLLEANRDRLVDPDNPDLILPGQELVLPEG